MSAICPSRSPMPGPPLPSAGSLGAGSPTSSVLSADSDPSPSVPPRFVSFTRRYHPCLVRSPGPRHGPGAWTLSVAAPAPLIAGGDGEVSQVPGRPSAGMPRSSTPADRLHLATPMQAMLPSANLTTSAPQLITFEARSRGLQAPCVRFAAGVAPGPRNTRFRLVASLGRIRIRTCWVAKKVSVMSLGSHVFLLHQALPGAISLSYQIGWSAIGLVVYWESSDEFQRPCLQGRRLVQMLHGGPLRVASQAALMVAARRQRLYQRRETVQLQAV